MINYYVLKEKYRFFYSVALLIKAEFSIANLYTNIFKSSGNVKCLLGLLVFIHEHMAATIMGHIVVFLSGEEK